MNFAESIDFINGLTDYEKSTSISYSPENYDLRRVELLLDRTGNPHLGRSTVHIAGTKGKGSTATMIAGVLKAAGFRTGLFTSPHLYSWTERIKIDGEDISEEDFAATATILQPHVAAVNGDALFGKLTTFEVLTAMGFLYFSARSADFQVLETGMGGRLDATSVARPDVCVLTSISLDHTQVLGDTLEKISVEKTGIIRKGCTVVSAPQSSEAAAVIVQKCLEMEANLIRLNQDITWKRKSFNSSGQWLTVKGRAGEYEFFIPLLGGHQLENAALAVAVIEALNEKGYSVSPEALALGMASVNWPGRLQILRTSPLVVADGAHNVDSISKLVRAVKDYFSYNRVLVVFGASADKDIAGMARLLGDLTPFIAVTRSGHARSADIQTLKQIFNRQGIKVATAKDVKTAVQNMQAKAEKEDLILVTGSLFTAADAGRLF